MQTLVQELTGIFEKELQKVFDKELKDGSFLNSEEFNSNEERMKAGIDIATEQVIKKSALYACIHRSKEHGDETSIESAKLTAEILPEYSEVSTRDFWSN